MLPWFVCNVNIQRLDTNIWIYLYSYVCRCGSLLLSFQVIFITRRHGFQEMHTSVPYTEVPSTQRNVLQGRRVGLQRVQCVDPDVLLPFLLRGILISQPYVLLLVYFLQFRLSLLLWLFQVLTWRIATRACTSIACLVSTTEQSQIKWKPKRKQIQHTIIPVIPTVFCCASLLPITILPCYVWEFLSSFILPGWQRCLVAPLDFPLFLPTCRIICENLRTRMMLMN